MTLYRIRFELCSAVVTPLKGDTIWGHIVWGIANHEGDDAVTKFLEQEKSESPALVVSSAFPAGTLCRALPKPKERTESLNAKKYSKIKEEKKNKYMAASEYFKESETPPAKTEDILNGVSVMHDATVMHNTIDRATNTVLEGGLYSIEEKWPGIFQNNAYTNIDWDIYILSSFNADRVKELVEWAFENGYGADASIGKGKIKIKDNPVPVNTKKSGKKYMALGPFVGAKELGEIRADIFIRSGKLGGSFVSGMSPHKKPVVLYNEGAVLESDIEIEYAGKLLERMHGTDKYNICQSGFAPVIPIGSDDKD